MATVNTLVQGGGGAGAGRGGGGGGAGGYQANASFAVTPQVYTITVGPGGTTIAADGSSSSFDTITATGGWRWWAECCW